MGRSKRRPSTIANVVVQGNKKATTSSRSNRKSHQPPVWRWWVALTVLPLAGMIRAMTLQSMQLATVQQYGI